MNIGSDLLLTLSSEQTRERERGEERRERLSGK
jgi:hypothetical protein